QVVDVEVDERVVPERVTVTARQEEVLPGLRQLGSRRIARARGEERLTGRNPPVVIGVARGEEAAGLECLRSHVPALVTGLAAEHGGRIREQGFRRLPAAGTLKGLREQARGEGELVALAGQAERVQLT